MNYRGSYRHLLGNATSAILAAIEIYNKPRFAYRDECFVILLLNASELLLKALLSKNRQSIFYKKERKKPYRTLSWDDAFNKAQKYFPKGIDPLPIRRNLDLLNTYRNNAVHFYNARDFGVLVYALAQTAIINFHDLLGNLFGVSLAEEVNWQLLPLGLRPPVSPIEYISGEGYDNKRPAAVGQFLGELRSAVKEVQKADADTGRLMTVFQVKLESTKKISDADVVVGVAKADQGEGPLVVVRSQDPNKTHPLRQMDVVEKIGSLHGIKFTSHTFQALARKYDLTTKSEYCWIASEGVLTRYSNDVVTFIKGLAAPDLEAALKDYKAYLHAKASKGKKAA